MPKLDADAQVAVKIAPDAGLLDLALSAEQRRSLFEHPGSSVVAIIELSSASYIGHAATEEKDPQVRLRVTACQAARDAAEESALRDAQRAMWRHHQIEGTLDEVGPGPRSAESVLGEALAGYPTEEEYAEHRRAELARERAGFVR
ncbi:hypothetical protein ACFV5N_09395 [Streptomyces sp. NPDC059853]|uniref:hypothetical protein n=1 Tax=Streptomyces TaxID=1883 RepID=UPI00365D20D9